MTRGIVAVTGAAGFVGRALCAHLAETGRGYRALVRTPKQAASLPHAVAVGDLASVPEGELTAALEGVHAVVHLAGRAHVMGEATQDAVLHRAANVVATERLAAAAVAASVQRFVFASTVKVHGEATRPGRPLRADDPLAPADAYARSKADAERALHAICAATSMVPIVLRTPLVYGPGVRANFLALIDEVARRAWLPLAAIDNRRDLLYIGNLAYAITALVELPEAPRGAWLVADGEAVSTPDLIRRVAAQLGVVPRLFSVPVPLLKAAASIVGRGSKVSRLAQSLEVDASPLAQAIGAMPHTLAQGLAATARWWRLQHAI